MRLLRVNAQRVVPVSSATCESPLSEATPSQYDTERFEISSRSLFLPSLSPLPRSLSCGVQVSCFAELIVWKKDALRNSTQQRAYSSRHPVCSEKSRLQADKSWRTCLWQAARTSCGMESLESHEANPGYFFRCPTPRWELHPPLYSRAWIVTAFRIGVT